MPFFPVGTQQTFLQGGTAPRSNPLPFYSLFFFYGKGTPFVQLLLTNDTPFTYLIQNEDCKKVGFSPLKSIFKPPTWDFRTKQTSLTSSKRSSTFLWPFSCSWPTQQYGLFCWTRTTGWFPTCGSSGGFIVNAINDIYRTTFTRTIILNLLMKLLLVSNLSQFLITLIILF